MGNNSVSDQLRIFISYSRADASIADELADALTSQGFDVTIDRRNLEFGAKWQAELADFIRLSDTVIWLVSDASIRSEWVNWELDEVARRNKRLVPVMVGNTQRHRLPRQLGEIHILPAEGMFDRSRDFDVLTRVLQTDHVWLKEASRLQDRAHEWLSNQRASGLLLRSAALGAAERWQENRPSKAPTPANEVLELILASRQAATRRQRWWAGGSLAVAAGAIGLSAIAYLQSLEAARQRDVAQRQALSSKLLSSALQQENRDPTFGMRLLQQARHAFPSATVATTSNEWYRSKQFYKVAVAHKGATSAIFLPNSLGFASASDDTVRLWDIEGKLLGEIAASGPIAVSPDGKQVVALTTRYGGVVRAIDVATGRFIADLPQLEGHTPMVIKFSKDSKRIAVGYVDGSVKILRTETGAVITLSAHVRDRSMHRGTTSLDFSPDGTMLVTGGDDNLIHIWSDEGRLIKTLPGHQNYVEDATFSPDSKLILSRSMDQTTRLWALDGTQRGQVRSHATYGRTALFTKYGPAFLSPREPDTLVLWDSEGKALQQFTAPGEIIGVDRSPDGQFVLTLHASRRSVDGDTTAIRLWRLRGLRSFFRPDGSHCVGTLAISSDAGLVTGPRDNCIGRSGARHLVGYAGGYINIFNAQSRGDPKVDAIGSDRSVTISQNGRLVGACGPRTTSFFNSDGSLVRSFDKTRCPTAVDPAGKYAVMAGAAGAVLWDRATDQLKTLDVEIADATFSPRGDSFLVVTRKGSVEHWSVEGRRLPVAAAGKPVTAIGFATDGSYALAFDELVRMWPVEEPAKVRAFEIGGTRPLELLYLPNRKVIVTRNFDKIRVWNLEGEFVGGHDSLDQGIIAMVPAPDGNSILAGTSGSTVMDVFISSPLSDFQNGSDLANFAPAPYVLAGVEGEFRKLVEEKDREVLRNVVTQFGAKAWETYDPDLLLKTLTLAERLAGHEDDIANLTDILAIMDALRLDQNFDSLLRTLKTRQLLEIVEFVERRASLTQEPRKSRSLKHVADAIQSMAASQKFPEFEARRARLAQVRLLGDARGFTEEAEEAAQNQQYDQVDKLYQRSIDAYKAAIGLETASSAQSEQKLEGLGSARKQLVEVLLSKGYFNYSNKKIEESVADWEAAAALAPEDSRPVSNIGFGLFELNRFAEALARFERAIELDATRREADPLCGRAIALYELGREDDAVRSYRSCVDASADYGFLERLPKHGWSANQIASARKLLPLVSK